MQPGWHREKKANALAVCRAKVSFFFTMTGPVVFVLAFGLRVQARVGLVQEPAGS
jgi:hypothetical protein